MTALRIFLGVLALLIAAAILFPVFAKAYNGPIFFVRDAAGNPIPGATLRFRDTSGRLFKTITTDDSGEYKRYGISRLTKGSTVDGYGLTLIGHSSGNGDRYVFTPLGSQTAFIHDTSGHPVVNMPIVFTPDGFKFNTVSGEVDKVTNPAGDAHIDCPLGARFSVNVSSGRWVVGKVLTEAKTMSVHYDVTLVAPAKITGRIVDLTGEKLDGCTINAQFVTGQPYAEDFSRWSYIDSKGRFRLIGLRPGVYSLTVTGTTNRLENTFTQKISVASGQALHATLHYSELDGAKSATVSGE